MPGPAPTCDLEDAHAAFARVQPEIDAIGDHGLCLVNVDLVAAAGAVLGCMPLLTAWRDRIARLPEFDLRHVDRLPDYAKATWYLHVTNLPQPEPSTGLEQDVDPLRTRLLRWAAPLAQSGIFDDAALARARRSRGLKTKASDLVALAALYRTHWEQVRAICAVTEADLDRASLVGSAVFDAASRREWRPPRASETLVVRRAWTLLDRAYTQCRRAITYLRYVEGDYDSLLPSLRRNAGPKGRRSVGRAAFEQQHDDRAGAEG